MDVLFLFNNIHVEL